MSRRLVLRGPYPQEGAKLAETTEGPTARFELTPICGGLVQVDFAYLTETQRLTSDNGADAADGAPPSKLPSKKAKAKAPKKPMSARALCVCVCVSVSSDRWPVYRSIFVRGVFFFKPAVLARCDTGVLHSLKI